MKVIGAFIYWRSKSGAEVDFVLAEGKVAIEVKIDSAPVASNLKGLITFCSDYSPKRAIVVCQAPRRRVIKLGAKERIEVLPWQTFLEALWAKEIIIP